MAFEQLLWLVPVFFMIHNLEETLFMEKWSKRFSLKLFQIQSTRQFVIAVSFLTAICFLLSYIGLEILEKPLGYMLVLEIQTALFVNAFFPHVGLAIRFREYNPGLFTALSITVPFSIYLGVLAYRENIIDMPRLGWLFGLSLLLIPVSIFISLTIGKLFAR